jgi:SAM-dependent methyltransferase
MEKKFCPICETGRFEFQPFGKPQPRNAVCPNCYSLEGHRLIWKYLNEKTNLFSGKQKEKLSHFAPEHCFQKNFSKRREIEYFPCDFSPELYDCKDAVNPVLKVDIINIPFPEESFDVILCSHVLEDIPDDARAMSELFRVLRKGGWAILQVPIDYKREKTYEDFSIVSPEAREIAFGQNDHVRWDGRDYKERLAKAGFVVTEDEFVKTFSSKEIFRYGFSSSELIYFCQKI